MNNNLIIIGAGASGIIAALKAKENNNKLNVILLEKTGSIGNKIKITGKGRCNITFDGDLEYFKKNITHNPKFIYSSFNRFSNEDLLKYVEDIGVKVKLERGNRYFLASNDADELVDKLRNKLKTMKVVTKLNESVKEIIVDENNNVKSVITDKNEYLTNKVILATGGKSYPGTGSTGDGYNIAKKLGHNITSIKPGLVGLKSSDNICKQLQGLNLKNIAITVTDSNKNIFNDFGEMIFTHFGISGPVILSSSSKINRVENLEEKLKENNIVLHIDLKPALDKDTLDKRLQRDFSKYTNKEFKNCLNDLLPKSIIDVIIKLSMIDEDKKVHQINKEERLRLLNLLKDFKVNISGLMSVETGIVTCGGIDLKEINPKTLESKKVKGLYFAGEVMDIDAYTGGFNLQIAFSTGVTASYYACLCEE